MEMFLIEIKNILLYCSIIFIFSNLLARDCDLFFS